jgi:hypothetical protein
VNDLIFFRILKILWFNDLDLCTVLPFYLEAALSALDINAERLKDFAGS